MLSLLIRLADPAEPVIPAPYTRSVLAVLHLLNNREKATLIWAAVLLLYPGDALGSCPATSRPS